MKVAIKDLGEIITGNTPSKSIPDFWNSKDIYFIKPDIISDENINYIKKSKEYISNIAEKKARVVYGKAIFVTCIGSIGKIGVIESGKYAFNQQINAIVPNENINIKYLAYNLLFNKKRLEAIANAPVVPIINKKQFGDFTINIERDKIKQEKITKVLDKISIIIDKRKQELIQLDNLIQSRFVEMFGDPITNSKLLPIEKIEERYFLKAGITTKAEDIHDYLKDKYEIPCYGGNGIRGYVENLSYEGCYPIIGRQGALCGNVQYATGKFHATEHAVLVSTLKNDNTMWVYYMLKLMDLYRYHTGAAQPGLAVKKLNTIDVIVADINLQNQFAAFVHQINKSKFVIHKFLYCTTHNTKSIIKPRPNTKESGKIRGGKPHADEF